MNTSVIIKIMMNYLQVEYVKMIHIWDYKTLQVLLIVRIYLLNELELESWCLNSRDHRKGDITGVKNMGP